MWTFYRATEWAALFEQKSIRYPALRKSVCIPKCGKPVVYPQKTYWTIGDIGRIALCGPQQKFSAMLVAGLSRKNCGNFPIKQNMVSFYLENSVDKNGRTVL